MIASNPSMPGPTPWIQYLSAPPYQNSNAISVTKEICDRVFAHACSAGTDAALRCDRQPRHRFVLEGDIRCRIFGAVGDDDRWHRRHAARRGCRGAQSRWQEGRRHENACQSKPQRAAACNSPRHSPTSAVPVQIFFLALFLLCCLSQFRTACTKDSSSAAAIGAVQTKPIISPCRGQFQEQHAHAASRERARMRPPSAYLPPSNIARGCQPLCPPGKLAAPRWLPIDRPHLRACARNL